MNEKKLELLNPDIFKANLILSGLFIAYFENTTDFIIDQPKNFFSFDYDSKNNDSVSPDYKKNVLVLDRKPINASLKWFKNLRAIDDSDMESFDDLRRYRNMLSHELTKILLEEGLDSDVYTENLNKLFSLRIKLEKWWFFYYEIEFMDIANPNELEYKDVTTGGEMIYQLFLDLLSDDKEKANYYLNELKKRFSK